jgi:hypothetical protein
MPLQAQNTVAEIQGYYGSLNIAERVLQSVWRNREFDQRRLSTFRGEPVEIIDPGEWNHLEGPDFRNARLRIGGTPVDGDVEIHLYAKDWVRHHHSRDPNYDRVVLHVTLFNSPDIRSEPRHRIVLLPFLEEDLESILARYMLENSFDPEGTREKWIKEFLGKNDPLEQHRLLVDKARIRWQQKLRYARQRLAREEWRQACHQYMLEGLGYRRNRIPMYELSLEYPLKRRENLWQAEDLFQKKREQWKLRGCRPSNHPMKRLQSYQRIVERDSNWPEVLLFNALICFGSVGCKTIHMDRSQMKKLRSALKLREFLKSIREEVFANEIGETRIHTLVCDVFLPLIAVNTSMDLFPFWYLWQAGDYPDQLKRIILESRLKKIKGSVQCNGWLQGLLQLGFESTA